MLRDPRKDDALKLYPIMLLIAVSACAPKAAEEKAAGGKPIGMPNPASVYCTEQGGKLEIRNGPDGQSGYCHLPDGRVIDEWEFFRSRPKTAG